MSWIRTSTKLDKGFREAIYLRRFSIDQRLAVGTHAFANVRPGEDPPDAIVDTSEGALGVESTILTIEPRRGAHALFLELRRRLVDTEPTVFSKLAGHVVYVWFSDDEVSLDRPHRKSQERAINDLLTELAAYKPDANALRMPGGSAPPEKVPPLPLAQTEAGARFYAVPMLGSAPTTVLFALAGFEIGLAYTTRITSTDAWAALQKLVDDHDKPGVDVLLVTTGGPDQRGQIFPADEAIAQMITRSQTGLASTPKHIKQVVLHSWTSGEATAIHPAIRSLFGPLYSGLTPAHQTIARQQVAEVPAI